MAVPKTSDGKPIVMASLFPGGVYYYHAGAGDTATTRGDGQEFRASITGTSASDPDPIEFGFMDAVYLAGGKVRWRNAEPGDWITMELVIPATPAPASTPGAGNCNVANGYLLVPAPGNGSHTVDLSTAVPVPAADEILGTASGYWEWSNPDTGLGTISASPNPGNGQYHLMTAGLAVLRFMNRLQLLGDGVEDVKPEIKPKKILPQWHFRAVIHSTGRPSGNLDIAWTVKLGRAKTA